MISNQYIRVKTDYYKIVEEPLLNGKLNRVLKRWTKETIRDDHGKDFLKEIPKYEDFVNYPSHINYQQIIKGFYNKYHPLDHSLKNGEFNNTVIFLKQLFQEHYPLVLDYFGILWKYPDHVLPILCLVSAERHTGKTTFLNWLKDIFQHNMTINTSQDFEGSFNSDWVDKLIVGVEEAKFEKVSTMNLIKNNSTAKHSKFHGKGRDKQEIPVFSKFIMTSNYTDNFANIDKDEIRFWIRELQPFQEKIINLEEKLQKEIPYFLYFIQHRKIETKKSSRMWFSKEQIYTDALDRIQNKEEINLENEIRNILLTRLDRFEIDSIKFTISEIQEIIRANHRKYTLTEIRNIIHLKWLLKPTENSTSYKFYQYKYCSLINDDKVEEISRKGRVYTFTREFLTHRLC